MEHKLLSIYLAMYLVNPARAAGPKLSRLDEISDSCVCASWRFARVAVDAAAVVYAGQHRHIVAVMSFLCRSRLHSPAASPQECLPQQQQQQQEHVQVPIGSKRHRMAWEVEGWWCDPCETCQ